MVDRFRGIGEWAENQQFSVEEHPMERVVLGFPFRRR
jgi:hypothetical protein